MISQCTQTTLPPHTGSAAGWLSLGILLSPCSASVGQWRSPRQTSNLSFLGGRYFLAASLLLLQYPWLQLSKPLIPPFLLLGLLISYAAVWSPRTAVGAARSLDVFCYARHKHRSLWLLVERSKIGERRGCVICQLYPDRLLKKFYIRQASCEGVKSNTVFQGSPLVLNPSGRPLIHIPVGWLLSLQ